MSVRGELGRGLRQWRWFRDVRRLQAEGLGHAAMRWQRWLDVLRTAPVQTDASGPLEIHLLCHKGDYLCAIWALKTLYRTSEARWPIVIHLNGVTPGRMVRRLQTHFPNARMIDQREADAHVLAALSSDYPNLLEARQHSAFMMKLVDPVLTARADRIFVLDSDVLFFRSPGTLRDHIDGNAVDGFLCQRDPESSYNITEAEAAAAFGIRMPECVNSGICVFPRELVDFNLCESLLEHPKVRRLTGYIEQTLFALCAGARGETTYLTTDYLVSLQRGVDYSTLTARHYAGPSRPMLTDEGMPYVMASRVLG